MQQVAAFDVDGTLTRSDTLLPFLVMLCGRRAVTAALAGAVRATGERFADRLVASGLRPAAVDRVAWHRERGHRLVMVSASLEAYLYPLADRLGFDDVVANCLEVAEDGRLTGRLDGGNVRRDVKVARLRALSGSDPVELRAYGNSSNDAASLAMADHPEWVGRARLPRDRRSRRQPLQHP